MGQKLRVLSANLWNGRADAKAFADLVCALDADVVAVQECAEEQAEALSEVMPNGLVHPSNDSIGMGLLLKHPCEVSMLELRYRGAPRVTLAPDNWPGLSRPTEIINVHFVAPHVLRPVMGLLARAAQMRDFRRHLDINEDIDEDIGTPNGTPVGTPETDGQRGPGAANIRQRIVVGDFNATPLWPLYWRMSSQFTDAAIAVARKSGCRAQRTWGPWSGAPMLLRIDHGFVTKGMRVDEFQAVPVRGSDHSAIVMDVLLD